MVTARKRLSLGCSRKGRPYSSFTEFSLALPPFFFQTILLSHAKHGSEDLLSTLPRAYISGGPIPFRLSIHRPSTSLRALWRKDSGTTRDRKGVRRLLTSLAAMWLLDLRQPRKRNRRKLRRKPIKHHQTYGGTAPQNIGIIGQY